MTIRQQGGVFGRNPTFNDLQVDGNATFDGSTLVVDGVNNRVGINSPSPRDTLEFKGLARLYDYSGQDVYTRVFTDPSGKLYLEADKGNTKASSGIVFTVDNAEAARFNSSGNLAFVDGNGIDFSATSGTGTSELFDDYEEGTWTPTPQNFDGTPTVEGYYTKIGNMVFASFRIALDGTADGSTFSVLLPFVSANVTNALFGGAISFSTSIATGLTFRIRDFSTEFRAYNSIGTELNYNQVGASSTVSGTIIYRAA